MNKTMWVNSDSTIQSRLSTGACSILLPLWWFMSKDNVVNKSQFIREFKGKRDRRTWDKYWTELVDNRVLARLTRHTWMVSPEECFVDDSVKARLRKQWEELVNG